MKLSATLTNCSRECILEWNATILPAALITHSDPSERTAASGYLTLIKSSGAPAIRESMRAIRIFAPEERPIKAAIKRRIYAS